MDFYDRKSKFRSDRIEKPSSSYKNDRNSSHHHYRDDRDDDYDYYNKKSKSSHSRSRSRSRSHSQTKDTQDTKYKSSSKLYQENQRTASKSSNNNSNNFNNKYDDASNNNYGNGNNNSIYGAQQSQVEQFKKFNPGTPSRTIMLRQLPTQMDDNELRTEFNMMLIPYKDIRLVKHRDTGLSRGFAFVEFGTVDEAQRWMNSTQGWVEFSNYNNKVQLFYSNSSADEANSINSASRKAAAITTDWDCAKCGIKNFKRRDKCFKCGITREESDRRRGGEGYDHVGATPCNTLLIRGLDALTTEETIIDLLNKQSNYTLNIKNCHVARDSFTNVSMGFAFVEMTSIQDAGYMLQVIQPNFEIDGKQVNINYSKNSFKTAISQIESQTIASYHQAAEASYTHQSNTNNKVNQADQANSAAAVAQAAMQSMHKKQELLSHITNNLKSAQQLGAVAITGDVDSSVGANLKMLAKQVDMYTKVYTAPDVTQFTYDETSGYYYDYTTGFYYDATSQYYFNSLTQQYMYWDPNLSTYVPVTSTGASVTTVTTQPTTETNIASATTTSETNNNQPAESANSKAATAKATPKTAAQIAKDMKKWAESMNKKKEIVKKPITTSTTVNVTSTPVVSEPKLVGAGGGGGSGFISGFALTETKEKSPEKEKESLNLDANNGFLDSSFKKTINESDSENSNEQVASKFDNSTTTGRGTGELMEEIKIDEASLIDLNKLACLLCKRKFDSLDILNKHIAKSDLHKTNLEKLKKEKKQNEASINSQLNENNTSREQQSSSDIDSIKAALMYRDRAKERREKYGTPEPPSPTYSSPPTTLSSSNKRPSDNDLSSNNSNTEKGESVANKLMKKMGWTEGTGIGKNLQGISAPIEATMRHKGSGLGSSSYDMDPNDSYKDAVRKSARARFEQLN